MVFVHVITFLTMSSPMFVGLLWMMARLTEPERQLWRTIPHNFVH